MAAMIWDEQAQAFKEAETPMKYDQTAGAWTDTTGMAWDNEAQAWVEKWTQNKKYMIYDNGKLSSSHSLINNLNKGTYVDGNSAYAYFAGIDANTKIDLSNYKCLKFTAMRTKYNESSIYPTVMEYDNLRSVTIDNWRKRSNLVKSQYSKCDFATGNMTTVSIDIESLVGECFVSLCFFQGGYSQDYGYAYCYDKGTYLNGVCYGGVVDFNIYELWLE